MSSCSKHIDDINAYSNAITKYDAAEFMPDLSAVSEYEDIEFNHYKKSSLLFTNNSLILIISYNEFEYRKNIETIESSYSFIEDNQILDNKDIFSQYSFTLGTYIFKVVYNESFDYPKKFGLIAKSDEENRIAYLWFNDPDLDFIDDFPQFIKDNIKYVFE